MKTLFLLLFSILIIGCEPNPNYKEPLSDAGNILTGMHELKQLDSAVYFKFSHDKVMFKWQLPDSSWAISSLETNKIRYKYNEDIEVPTIKFKWLKVDGNNLVSIMKDYVTYAVIECKENQK